MSLGMAVRRSGGEIPKKPIARQNDNAVEGSGFLEEVGRARHDFEALLEAEKREGASVQTAHRFIMPANDEQC
jgi:hypothetical protein